MGRGRHRGLVPNKGALGGLCVSKDQDSDSAAYPPLPRAIASTVGTWPDQVQGSGRALRFPWFQLKQASVQANFPAPHHAGHAHLLWMELEHVVPTKAMLEGEGNAF